MEGLINEASKSDFATGVLLIGIGLIILVIWKKLFGDQ